jgi:hypothetical protein
MANPTNITLGTVNGGSTAIVVDASVIVGTQDPVLVTLTTAYTLAAAPYLQAAGYPTEPGLTGVMQANLTHGGLVIPSGTTILLFSTTAAALVLAGAAVYG